MTTFRARPGGAYTPSPSRGDCPTGKMQFATRKQARRAARAMNDSALGVYRCECGWLHVGHMPKRVRNGDIPKDDWLAATQGDRR